MDFKMYGRKVWDELFVEEDSKKLKAKATDYNILLNIQKSENELLCNFDKHMAEMNKLEAETKTEKSKRFHEYVSAGCDIVKTAGAIAVPIVLTGIVAVTHRDSEIPLTNAEDWTLKTVLGESIKTITHKK